MVLTGKGVSSGLAVGPVYFIDRAKTAVLPRAIEDTERETARFSRAVEEAKSLLAELAAAAAAQLGEENAALFEVHEMILEDPDFYEETLEMIREERVCAEYAAQQVGALVEQSFIEMEDEYMSARAADIRDVTRRVVDCLTGADGKLGLSCPSILAADDIAPSELALLDKKMLLGIAVGEGSANSHTAIFARTLGIPAIVGLGDALCAETAGRTALLDADAGTLALDPSAELLKEAGEKMEKARQKQQENEKYRGKKSVTKSGRSVKLFANVASAEDLEAVIRGDAEGVGLFRSEFLFLGREDAPGEEEQFLAYKAVAQGLAGKPVIIRTLDIGADKQAGYLGLPQEENPALGLRAVRLCLERPELFKTQLRAIYRASAYGNVHIMFPMIASVWELARCREMAGEVQKELTRQGIPIAEKVPLGIMVETPAAALISDLLAPMADFFSLGTNDLIQYTLAADRQNAALCAYSDAHHEAVLRLIAMTAENGKKQGIWTGICGDLAADPQLTDWFLRQGIAELSVPPSQVLSLRAHMARLD